jgi:DNA modification methylase
LVTSPPYWGLRDYKIPPQVWGGDHGCVHELVYEHGFCRLCGAWKGCFGLEPAPELYIEHAVQIFREVRRVLRSDGTLWLNIGDCYASNGGHADTNVNERRAEIGVAARPDHKNRSFRVGTDCDPKRGKATKGQPIRYVHGPFLKPKDLVGAPWMLALALRADGWYLRQDIIWSKPNPMPESVTDRCTKAHEYLFLLTKSPRYYFCAAAIKEPVAGDPEASRNRWDIKDYLIPGQKPQKRTSRKTKVPGGWETEAEYVEAPMNALRNKRSVWTIATQPYAEAHFATFPEALVEPCILAGSKVGDVVLDPFAGSGTTLAVALRYQRNAIGIELSQPYSELIRRRVGAEGPLLHLVEIVPAGEPYAAEPTVS